MILKKTQAKNGFSTPTQATVSAALVLGILLLPALAASKSPHQPVYTVLHRFSGGDGANPAASLIQDPSGNLYGTTQYGGSFNYGTVFKLEPSGKETVLHSFDGADGMWPTAALIRDAAGALYGTTFDGGTREGGGCVHGCGTVFKINSVGKFTVLYAFTGGADGGNPATNLILDSAANLYGTTYGGGNFCSLLVDGCGVVFKLNQHGEETVLYSFTETPDGGQPSGGLVRDEAGNLYGTTQFQGATGYFGTVFELDSAGVETILYNFTDGTDGAGPQGTLVRDADGNLYGETQSGGDLSVQNCVSGLWKGCGVLFKLAPSGEETILYTFTDGSDGRGPLGGLLRDRARNLYGVTGSCCGGLLFKLSVNGKLHVLHTFEAPTGILPFAGVIMDSAGNLYGTAWEGGNSGCLAIQGCGVVFKLTP
ncbi:MAG TPA: choice-of-anchor tandem repeat GloVer-containing protein [Terriglobales bacterium]|nr:choice-of-anchor tandem repeat GloVer-containing protein [Terriglobales bacterium]